MKGRRLLVVCQKTKGERGKIQVRRATECKRDRVGRVGWKEGEVCDVVQKAFGKMGRREGGGRSNAG